MEDQTFRSISYIGTLADHRGENHVHLLNHPTKSETEALIGSVIPQDIWDFQPWGSRILIRRDKTVEQIGRIHVPDSAQELLQSGVVVKVGTGVGESDVADCPYPDPALLVGLPVIFGMWSGKVINASDEGVRDLYEGHWLLMHENDIWGHSNTNPEGLQTQSETAQKEES